MPSGRGRGRGANQQQEEETAKGVKKIWDVENVVEEKVEVRVDE